MDPLLNGAGTLVAEKAELLHAVIAFVLTDKNGPWEPLTQEIRINITATRRERKE